MRGLHEIHLTFWNFFFHSTANCLDCKQCKIGVLGICFFGNDVSCSSSTESCYTGQARKRNQCSYLMMICLLKWEEKYKRYQHSITCCNTDLCNGASSVQLPLTVALCAAILSSLWGFLEF
uniref:UPAR/Ly6 domain-containing protein n=1 Tax=Cyprinodon variegatus TaxID=28743 RepID=A0A3Q2G7X0_CYPVA